MTGVWDLAWANNVTGCWFGVCVQSIRAIIVQTLLLAVNLPGSPDGLQ